MRIIRGLNGLHGCEQPARTWSIGDEWIPHTWEILHNGRLAGEIAWTRCNDHHMVHLPTTHPQVWQSCLLAGMNWPGTTEDLPPEPAPPERWVA